jgi:enoyl-[acyl-carrier protein] reductase II
VWTAHFETHPEELQPFPAQAFASARAGVNHLGAADDTDVEIRREFMPCGQGVGAIGEVTPAGDVVRAMVDEAEAALDRLLSLRRT